MAFGLLYNLYKWLKKKAERKITLVVLGIDNAGKTTLLNTIKGDLDKEVTPTFGFNSQHLEAGKYKIEAEVHGVIYVVDAADSARLEESRTTLQSTLAQQHLLDKPLLIFANKQDLPTAATAGEVAEALGLPELRRNPFHILPCVAKAACGQLPDARLKAGMTWLISAVDDVFSRLDVRVQKEADEVRQEELQKKKEREEMVRKMKEERLRKAQEEAAAAAAASDAAGNIKLHQTTNNTLSALPHQVESPKTVVPSSSGAAPAGPVINSFTDLQHPDRTYRSAAPAAVTVSASAAVPASASSLAASPAASKAPSPLPAAPPEAVPTAGFISNAPASTAATVSHAAASISRPGSSGSDQAATSAAIPALAVRRSASLEVRSSQQRPPAPKLRMSGAGAFAEDRPSSASSALTFQMPASNRVVPLTLGGMVEAR